MSRTETSTETCARNGGGDACPIYYATGPKTKNYYTARNHNCIACEQIYKQLYSMGILSAMNVGNVSRPIFNRGIAEVRAREYQPHPPSHDSNYYLELVEEVIAYAKKPEVDDAAFETQIGIILAREASLINAADDDEEQAVEELAVVEQETAKQLADKQVTDEQVADKQDEAQGSVRSAHVSREAVILAKMKNITDRQAKDASDMLELIAELRRLSVGK
ncbi:hypothetical protein KVV02_005533 [Mortierella alpina]|uniref:Uncharacterized protein n=1 Tax=Mortierella alpina TaxID=64518 RepID=A0A9P7ZWT4_MORAP|nr:hypothetical protein KVV02_005533 [Mortierella alpina]